MNIDIAKLMTASNTGVGAGIWACVEWLESILGSYPLFKKVQPALPVVIGAIAGATGVIQVSGTAIEHTISGSILGAMIAHLHTSISALAKKEGG